MKIENIGDGIKEMAKVSENGESVAAMASMKAKI